MVDEARCKITDLDDLARRLGHGDGAALTAVLARRNGWARRPGVQGEVAARLEHGRWLADCPYCGGAELVSRRQGEFFCLSCGMAENGGQAMRAVFPAAREEIEGILAPRRPLNRNWLPGETVRALRAENRRYGVDHESAKGSENAKKDEGRGRARMDADRARAEGHGREVS